MHIILTPKDLQAFSPKTRDEIERFVSKHMFASTAPVQYRDVEDMPAEFNFDDSVKDFTHDMIKEFFSVRVSDSTTLGLRLIAEKDVPYISVQELIDAGITNYGHFQSRVTTRTRTVTGEEDAFMFAWDSDWAVGEDGVRSGRYAVTPITHRSLKRYFNTL